MFVIEILLLAMTAFGTLALAGITAYLATQDIILRNKKRDDDAKVASILLWPILRRYLAEINLLQEMIDLEDFSYQDRHAFEILRELDSIYEQSLSLIKDLPSQWKENGLRAIAHLNHAQRHLVQISQEGWRADMIAVSGKIPAATRSLAEARREIVPLIEYCKNIIDHKSGQNTVN